MLAEYKCEAIAKLVEPDFRRPISAAEIRGCLDLLMRGGLCTAEEAAKRLGITSGAVKNRLCANGAKSVGVRCRKALWRWCDIYAAFPNAAKPEEIPFPHENVRAITGYGQQPTFPTVEFAPFSAGDNAPVAGGIL